MTTYTDIQSAVKDNQFNFFVVNPNEVHAFDNLVDAQEDKEDGEYFLAQNNIQGDVEIYTLDEAKELFN